MKTIKVTNAYLDTMINSPIMQTITKKPFKAKTSYWLARAFDKLQREAKIYFTERQKLIEKYAKRYDEDGEERRDGKVIKEWKKGDMVSNGQSVSLTNMKEFTREISELTEIEIDIGINKIKFDLDKEPACNIEEMVILLPLMEVDDG